MRSRDVLTQHLDLIEMLGDGVGTPLARYLNSVALADKLVTKGEIAPVVARNLRRARAYQIVEPMTAVINARAEAMHELDRVGDDHRPPRPAAFVVFETPIEYTELRGRMQIVHALCWGQAADQRGNPGYVVTTFNDLDRKPDEIAEMTPDFREHFGRWHGISTYWLARSMRIGPEWISPTEETALRIVSEGDTAYPVRSIMRAVLALWDLLDETISTHTAGRVDRAAHRLLKRHKLPSEVTVITLRREAQPVLRPGTGTPLDHRVWVEQFSRLQWVGSGANRRQERRNVRGHWRGPEDAPVEDRPKVNRLSR